MSETRVEIRTDGPICVVGKLTLVDGEGRGIVWNEEEGGMFLCRCGRSLKKPFCDGTHKRTGWKESETS